MPGNAFTRLLERIPRGQSVDSFVRGGLDPSIVDRGTLVPLGRNVGGGVELAVPEAGIDIIKALMTTVNPHAATQGS